MEHIKQILRREGLLVDDRVQVVGVDRRATLFLGGQFVSDAMLEVVAELGSDDEQHGTAAPRAVVIDPVHGTVAAVVEFDQRIPYVPIEQRI